MSQINNLVKLVNLHYPLRVPKDGIGVEIGSWIKPKPELLLSTTFSIGKDVGVKSIRLPANIT